MEHEINTKQEMVADRQYQITHLFCLLAFRITHTHAEKLIFNQFQTLSFKFHFLSSMFLSVLQELELVDCLLTIQGLFMHCQSQGVIKN